MENKKFEVDIEILKKYDRPGPRYTSYPTAPHFRSDFTPEAYHQHILESNKGEDLPPLSLYFHLPFCKTLCYYCGCNMIITHSRDKIEDYLGWLKREIQQVSSLVNENRQVVQLHWGGGSPDYLTPKEIRDLAGYIQDHFSFADEAEISVEIDPRRLTEDHLPALREMGFNRISFGVQDFDPKVQETVNRIQPEELTRKVIAEARELGFHSVNVDLIYGLPFQTLDTYRDTLDKVIDMAPDRLAVFNYAHVPWMKKHQKILKEEDMPGAEEKLKMLKLIIETLTANGYCYIGMDHFAGEDDPLTRALKEGTLHRNFQGYTTWKEAEIYAMGITAISQHRDLYAQNVKVIPAYKEKLTENRLPVFKGYVLTEDDKIRRYAITELMCNNQLNKKKVEEKFSIDFDKYFAPALEKLEPFVKDELVTLGEDRIEVSRPGRLVIRNVAMCFDAFLDKDQNRDQPIYSRTV